MLSKRDAGAWPAGARLRINACEPRPAFWRTFSCVTPIWGLLFYTFCDMGMFVPRRVALERERKGVRVNRSKDAGVRLGQGKRKHGGRRLFLTEDDADLGRAEQSVLDHVYMAKA